MALVLLGKEVVVCLLMASSARLVDCPNSKMKPLQVLFINNWFFVNSLFKKGEWKYEFRIPAWNISSVLCYLVAQERNTLYHQLEKKLVCLVFVVLLEAVKLEMSSKTAMLTSKMMLTVEILMEELYLSPLHHYILQERMMKSVLELLLLKRIRKKNYKMCV